MQEKGRDIPTPDQVALALALPSIIPPEQLRDMPQSDRWFYEVHFVAQTDGLLNLPEIDRLAALESFDAALQQYTPDDPRYIRAKDGRRLLQPEQIEHNTARRLREIFRRMRGLPDKAA